MYISTTYAKIFGESNFQPLETSQSGSKANTEKKEREKRKKTKKLVITMASYALQRHLGWRTQSRLVQHSAAATWTNPSPWSIL